MNKPFTIYVVARQESIDKTIVKTNIISSFTFPNDNYMHLCDLFKEPLPYELSVGKNLCVAKQNETILFFERWVANNILSPITTSIMLPFLTYLQTLNIVALREVYCDCDIDIILKQ